MTKEQVSEIESLGVKTYSTEGLGDFISLTNLAAKQGSASLLDDWLKNKNTIEEGEENFVGDSEIIALGGASNETKDRPLG